MFTATPPHAHTHTDVSGVDYYKGICEQYAQLKGKRHLMPPNPLMLLASVDCDVYAKMLCESPVDFVRGRGILHHYCPKQHSTH